MSGPEASDGGRQSVLVTAPTAAVLRLAAARLVGYDALVLADPANGWQLVASTSPVTDNDRHRIASDLRTVFDDASGDCRGSALPICGGSASAYPLRGAQRTVGVLVLRPGPDPVGAAPTADVLADVVRCLTETLAAAELRADAEFVGQSSRAVRRLFVEGAQAQDVREAGTVLARVAADTFRTERAGVYVIDDDGIISFAIGVGVPDTLSEALAASLVGKLARQSPVWQVLEKLNGPYLVNDSRYAQMRPGGFVETMAFQSYVAIPLMSTDGPLGMVICGDASRSRAWTDRERDLANQFALEAALIIDAARLRAAQRAQVALLKHEANHDGLTGLANRRLLMSHLDGAMQGAPTEGSTLAMLLLDLDDFKRVNDTLGHRAGDDLLREVGSRLHPTLHREDMLARLGGDEFAIVLSGSGAGRQAALATADRIEAALAEPIVLDGIPINAVASIGIALYPEQAQTAADLLQHADVAMYAAKRSSNGAVVYEDTMNDATADRLVLYSELRRAIPNDELVLVYQPKLDLKHNVVIGVESLVRWQHPRRGLLSPAEFLPLAESSELIHPLTAWVIEHSLRQHREWAELGLDLDLAINMSARNLLNTQLLSQIECLIRADDAPARLIVEVTETSVMTNPGQSIQALHRLRDLGVRISMDDFGTGHSSLALLGQLPVDELKIDRALVQAANSAGHDRALVDTIIHLGHRLGLTVVAEGIETTQTLHLMQELGCDVGQGYLFSPPLHPGELTELATVRRLAFGDATPSPHPAALHTADRSS